MTTRKIDDNERKQFESVLKTAFDALNEKGYDAIAQLAGYILSEDPTYITIHKNARKLLSELDHEEIVRYLLEVYFKV